MDMEKRSTEEIIAYYREDVRRLMRYLPYLKGKKAEDVSRKYSGGAGENTMHFPVYDGTLLSFVKEAQKTVFMDRNYRYVYSRHNIRTWKDEWKQIEEATLLDMGVLGGILSRYVLGGMTKGTLWTDAVEHEIYCRVIEKAADLIEFWDHQAGGIRTDGELGGIR